MVWIVAAVPTRVLPAKVTEVGATVRVGGTVVHDSETVSVTLTPSSLVIVRVAEKVPPVALLQRITNGSVTLIAMAPGVLQVWPVQPWSVNENVVAPAPLIAIVEMFNGSVPVFWTFSVLVAGVPAGVGPIVMAATVVSTDWVPVPLSVMLVLTLGASLVAPTVSVLVLLPTAAGLNVIGRVAVPPPPVMVPLSTPTEKSVMLVSAVVSCAAVTSRSPSFWIVNVRVSGVPPLWRCGLKLTVSCVIVSTDASPSPSTVNEGSGDPDQFAVTAQPDSAARDVGVKITSTVTEPSVEPSAHGDHHRRPPRRHGAGRRDRGQRDGAVVHVVVVGDRDRLGRAGGADVDLTKVQPGWRHRDRGVGLSRRPPEHPETDDHQDSKTRTAHVGSEGSPPGPQAKLRPKMVPRPAA